MSYTRNFGFRDLTNIIRDGRNAVPTGLTGSDANGFLIGTAVTVDPANPGKLKRPAAAAAPTALSGIVIYEHIQFQGVDPFLTTQYDTPFIYAPQGRYAQMVHGLGVKVWFKNTTDIPLYDGRTQAGGTLVPSVQNLSVGDYLVPDASGLWVSTSSSEVQTVTISGTPTGGTFTLTFDGQTTSALAYNAAASAVQAALIALNNIDAGGVLVTGSAGGPYTVTFSGPMAGGNEVQMTATSSLTGGTTPSVAVATSTQGGTASASNAWLQVESVVPSTGLVEARLTF